MTVIYVYRRILGSAFEFDLVLYRMLLHRSISRLQDIGSSVCGFYIASLKDSEKGERQIEKEKEEVRSRGT